MRMPCRGATKGGLRSRLGVKASTSLSSSTLVTNALATVESDCSAFEGRGDDGSGGDVMTEGGGVTGGAMKALFPTNEFGCERKRRENQLREGSRGVVDEMLGE